MLPPATVVEYTVIGTAHGAGHPGRVAKKQPLFRPFCLDQFVKGIVTFGQSFFPGLGYHPRRLKCHMIRAGN